MWPSYTWLKNLGNSIKLNQKCQESMRYTDTNLGLIPRSHKDPQDIGPTELKGNLQDSYLISTWACPKGALCFQGPLRINCLLYLLHPDPALLWTSCKSNSLKLLRQRWNTWLEVNPMGWGLLVDLYCICSLLTRTIFPLYFKTHIQLHSLETLLFK